MCADGHEHSSVRPSLRAVIANWQSYDAPRTTKLRMAVRNYWTRIRTRSSCCGNDGQPGC